MSYIGVGYTGTREKFLRQMVERHIEWLQGDRQPHFYGDSFIVLYDSNTAREFARRCAEASDQDSITIYPMGRPFEWLSPSARNS